MVDPELNNLMKLIPFTLRKAIIGRIQDLDPKIIKFFDTQDFNVSNLNSFIVVEKLPSFVAATCLEIFNIDIKSKRRFREICELRHAAIWIICRCTKNRITMKQIGFYFERTHSSISTSVQKCEDLMFTSKDYCQKVSLLCNALADKGYVDAMIELIKFFKAHGKQLNKNIVLSESFTEILNKHDLLEKTI